MLLVDHATNPMPYASRGGTTPISIVTFHAINGMRLIDPVADLALGMHALKSAQRRSQDTGRQCPFGSGSNCTVHWAIAVVITAASIVDFATVVALLHGLHVFKSVSDITKQRVCELVMLTCEAAVFVGAVLVSHYDMLAEAGTAESRCASVTAAVLH